MEFLDWKVPQNEGLMDRFLRIVAGIFFFAGAAGVGWAISMQFLLPSMAGLGVLLGAIAMVLIISGFLGYCPLYSFIGAWLDTEITTCPRKLTRVELLEKNVYTKRQKYW